MARAVVVLLALGLAMVGAVGCGEEEGVAKGGTVTAYVEEPLCGGKGLANDDTLSSSGMEFEVRLVCLPDPSNPRGGELSQGVGGPQRIDLAVVGANARRATEDSATVAYVQTDDPAITQFTEPILDAAGIGLIAKPGRIEAWLLLQELLLEADPNSLRADVREALEAG